MAAVSRRRLTQLESTPPVGTVELRNDHGPQQRAALMKRTTKYVGLDVHQAMTVATVRSDLHFCCGLRCLQHTKCATQMLIPPAANAC